ncbi:NUDIX hydrolase [Desulfococcaceae bacterium HSG9]|nr:NUDIX hydrolase [Desulfococcaceae bacterium HSG9]
MSIYPDSPQVAVGAVVFKQNKVLLVKRGKPPSQNEWAIPGGSVELGETLQQAAEREIYEETGIVIRAQEPIFVFDMVQKDESDKIRFHYIIIDLIAEYKSGKLLPGDDALDARWFTENEIKNPIINRMTQNLLEKYFNRPENWASNLALI